MASGDVRRLVEELAASLEELRRVGESFAEARERLKALSMQGLPFRLPAFPEVALTYNVDIELPEELGLLREGLPRRVKRVTVEVREEKRGVRAVIEVEGEGGWRLVGLSAFDMLGDFYAAAVLWDLLRQHGVDFLADLKRVVEERVEALKRMIERLNQLAALLQVALA
ncbi:MAG: hypothetical protein QW517_10490 [Thermofilaceae archaeon]